MATENELSTVSEIVRQAMGESYGIEGVLTRLPGENLNFLVEAPDGRKWVAKIAGKEQAADFIEMEYAALQWAGKAKLGLAFPNILENIHGKFETRIVLQDKSDNRLRMIEYIPGKNWSDYPDISTEMRFDLGASLARLDLALQGFDHPQAHRPHRWDLADAGQHRA
jgi:Ser/Thr protein kinase RdoA (MazF antagonist)